MQCCLSFDSRGCGTFKEIGLFHLLILQVSHFKLDFHKEAFECHHSYVAVSPEKASQICRQGRKKFCQQNLLK